MGTGRYDLEHSHRGYNEPCIFWNRDESVAIDLSNWQMESKPTGYFFAKELSDQSGRGNNTGGTFYGDYIAQTIETVDDVDDIRKGSVVKYLDDLWIVTDIKKSKHGHKSFYSKYAEYKYIINLRR